MFGAVNSPEGIHSTSVNLKNLFFFFQIFRFWTNYKGARRPAPYSAQLHALQSSPSCFGLNENSFATWRQSSAPYRGSGSPIHFPVLTHWATILRPTG